MAHTYFKTTQIFYSELMYNKVAIRIEKGVKYIFKF